MPVGVLVMAFSVVLIVIAAIPGRRYLNAYAAQHRAAPRFLDWLIQRDPDPEVERLRRKYIAARGSAYLVFLAGLVLNISGAR